MTQPRSQIVQPECTRYYHCVARCVRRAWLCGEDDYTGGNFDHRKSWLLARMKALEEVFAIRVAAYAVTGNHYHVVLYLDIEQGRAWDRDEVIGRWTRLFSGDPLARAYLRGGLDGAALGQVDSVDAGDSEAGDRAVPRTGAGGGVGEASFEEGGVGRETRVEGFGKCV